MENEKQESRNTTVSSVTCFNGNTMHTLYLGKTEGVFIDLVDYMWMTFGKSD